MLYEKLTEDEVNIIEKLRHDYCDTNSDFFSGKFCDTKTFLRFWEAEKAPMIEAFGNRLIVKKPISVTMQDDEMFDKMDDIFRMHEYSIASTHIMEMIERYNPVNWEESNIVSNTGRSYSLYHIFHYILFDVNTWASNRYDGPSFEVKLANGNTIKVAHGCKVMKALGRMAKACDDEIVAESFETLRLRQSQVLNEARINANLCISIHPIDYMTASYNANNWHSCMSWEDGEFRRGVIEMMNSPYVVVGYIESKNNHLTWEYPHLEWNSKRWREFFIVRPDMICGIKGYPYWNRDLEDEAITMLREMFAPIFNAKYSSTIYHWQVSRDIEDDAWDLYVKPEMSCGPAMYNDFYNDNEYHAVFAYGLHGDDSGYRPNSLAIDYSGASECVICGEDSNDFDGEGELICCGCIDHRYCCKCGEIIYNDWDLVEFEGRDYCKYCYDQLDACDRCGDVIDPDCDEDSLEFCVCWDDVDPEVGPCSTDDVLREIEDEWNARYRPAMKISHICSTCAKKIFMDGRDEIAEPHSWHNEYFRYYVAIPLSHFTQEGIETLLDPEELEAFKAKHATETLSA